MVSLWTETKRNIWASDYVYPGTCVLRKYEKIQSGKLL